MTSWFCSYLVFLTLFLLPLFPVRYLIWPPPVSFFLPLPFFTLWTLPPSPSNPYSWFSSELVFLTVFPPPTLPWISFVPLLSVSSYSYLSLPYDLNFAPSLFLVLLLPRFPYPIPPPILPCTYLTCPSAFNSFLPLPFFTLCTLPLLSSCFSSYLVTPPFPYPFSFPSPLCSFLTSLSIIA